MNHLQPRTDYGQGFTLVELSIVLVILGLLVGGVLSGQSLIHAAELRSVTADVNRFQAATYTFRDKYFALPGDMTNATKYWGTDPNGCPSNSVQTVRTQTCDGNGDGQIGSGNWANAAPNNEAFRAIQQLANAGLIEGGYTGVSGPNYSANGDAIPGTNVPRSKISGLGWTMSYWPYANWAYMPGGNYLIIGPEAGGPTISPGSMNMGESFKGEDAYSIDKKIDDGMPGTGAVYGYNWYRCTLSGSLTEPYILNSTTANLCGLFIRLN